MRARHILNLLPPIVSALIPPDIVEPRSNVDTASVPKAQLMSEHFWVEKAKDNDRTLCFIQPDKNGGDDAPAIIEALNKNCRTHGLVVFPAQEYNIKSPMTTLYMNDVEIHLFGKLLWSKDVDYWLSVSMPVNFQNQSTVWYFGGDNVVLDGHGQGTFDGNGQVWYDWAKSQGNLPHRPMNVNFRKLTNSVVKGMRFVQSQMWTMAITYSKNVLLEDIFVKSVSNSEYSTLNTDGADTVYSDNITFRRWDVTSGDDGIALKGNSSNISVYDSVFHGGQGLAIGSMGQFNGKYEYIENFYANNITMYSTAYVMYLKTWGGVSRGYPPNGGGGGIGHARNITVEDVVINGGRKEPFFAWQCENYSGHSGEDCNSSKFKMEDVYWRNIRGTTNPDVKNAGNFRCSSSAGGCTNINVEDFEVRRSDGTAALDSWHCENVNKNKGFECNS